MSSGAVASCTGGDRVPRGKAAGQSSLNGVDFRRTSVTERVEAKAAGPPLDGEATAASTSPARAAGPSSLNGEHTRRTIVTGRGGTLSRRTIVTGRRE